jgi:hypothetical protein
MEIEMQDLSWKNIGLIGALLGAALGMYAAAIALAFLSGPGLDSYSSGPVFPLGPVGLFFLVVGSFALAGATGLLSLYAITVGLFSAIKRISRPKK